MQVVSYWHRASGKTFLLSSYMYADNWMVLPAASHQQLFMLISTIFTLPAFFDAENLH